MVDDDDGDESPSPEPRTDSRSALLREIRAWRRLGIVKHNGTFSLIFSLRNGIYRVRVEVGGASGDPRDRGVHPGGRVRPPPSWTGCGPPGLDSFAGIIYIFQNLSPWIFRSPRTFVFCTINNIMAVLLKTASVWVSFIQIIQVRVQNKGKSVCETRYVGEISTRPSLNLCLSSSNSVDKLKVEKKTFTNSFALVYINKLK